MSITTLDTATISRAIVDFDSIKAAIEHKDIPVGNAPTGEYGPLIDQIQVHVPPVLPPDPWQVYLSTRPTDWLKMPARHSEAPQFAQSTVAQQEIRDNEVYVLFHIPVGTSSLIAFITSCTGQSTVEIGTMTDGLFAPNPAYTVSLASGAKYENELRAADFGDVTADGFAQCMIRIRAPEIQRWYTSAHSKKPLPSGYANWNVMEIAGLASAATQIGPMTGVVVSILRKLRYYALYGTNNVTNLSNLFNGNNSLVAILALDTRNVAASGGMLITCGVLRAVPAFRWDALTNAGSLFNTCYSVTRIDFDAPNCTNLVTFAQNATALTTVRFGRLGSDVNVTNLFSGCMALVTVLGLPLSSVAAGASSLFGTTASSSLQRLTFTGGTWATPQNLSIANGAMLRDALAEMFSTLPTVASAVSLTLTGNPGVAELTAADTAVATGKGWTLVL